MYMHTYKGLMIYRNRPVKREGEIRLKQIIFLLVVISIVIFQLVGCTNEAITPDELLVLTQQNELLKEANAKIQSEVDSLKEKTEVQVEEKEIQQQPVPDDTIRSLLRSGKERFFYVSSGGGIKEYKAFEYNGNVYRYLGEDLNSKEELMEYLGEIFTPQVVNEILNKLKIIEHNGNMAQPDGDYGSLLDWGKSLYTSIELDGPTITVRMNVPLDETGLFEEKIVEFKYQEGTGWRINSLLH